jgi:hypothetical protein
MLNLMGNQEKAEHGTARRGLINDSINERNAVSSVYHTGANTPLNLSLTDKPNKRTKHTIWSNLPARKKYFPRPISKNNESRCLQPVKLTEGSTNLWDNTHPFPSPVHRVSFDVDEQAPSTKNRDLSSPMPDKSLLVATVCERNSALSLLILIPKVLFTVPEQTTSMIPCRTGFAARADYFHQLN